MFSIHPDFFSFTNQFQWFAEKTFPQFGACLLWGAEQFQWAQKASIFIGIPSNLVARSFRETSYFKPHESCLIGGWKHICPILFGERYDWKLPNQILKNNKMMLLGCQSRFLGTFVWFLRSASDSEDNHHQPHQLAGWFLGHHRHPDPQALVEHQAPWTTTALAVSCHSWSKKLHRLNKSSNKDQQLMRSCFDSRNYWGRPQCFVTSGHCKKMPSLQCREWPTPGTNPGLKHFCFLFFLIVSNF